MMHASSTTHEETNQTTLDYTRTCHNEAQGTQTVTVVSRAVILNPTDRLSHGHTPHSSEFPPNYQNNKHMYVHVHRTQARLDFRGGLGGGV